MVTNYHVVVTLHLNTMKPQYKDHVDDDQGSCHVENLLYLCLPFPSLNGTEQQSRQQWAGLDPLQAGLCTL